MESDIFSFVPLSAATLHVPAGTKELYKVAPVWKEFGTIVEYGGEEVTLSVSSAAIEFPASGGTQSVSVSSNTDWEAAGSAEWLNISPASGTGNGTVSFTAAPNTGDVRTATVTFTAGGVSQTVSVAQKDSSIQVVDALWLEVEPARSALAGSSDTLRVLLSSVQADGRFEVRFDLTLPSGFRLNSGATALIPPWDESHALTLSSAGTRRFTIEPEDFTSVIRNPGREFVDIVYTVDPALPSGIYEVKLSDIQVVIRGSTTTVQEDLTVPVTVTNLSSAEAVEAPEVWYDRGVLTVRTPVAEEIAVYTVSGSLLCLTQKAPGEAVYRLTHLPRGVLIVKGSSGWVKKIAAKY
jgi:hypothetical protein